jgi:hypothetical protein
MVAPGSHNPTSELQQICLRSGSAFFLLAVDYSI